MEPILISPHLVYKVNCPVDLTAIAERSAKLLDTIIDPGEVEQDGGITSTGHLDATLMGRNKTIERLVKRTSKQSFRSMGLELQHIWCNKELGQ